MNVCQVKVVSQKTAFLFGRGDTLEIFQWWIREDINDSLALFQVIGLFNNLMKG